mmetsp:Transcript_9192/g.14650  ORF Transcript_9192/g.14650 Transcript_9192/m.14650 type:complete len:82 (-) Transcript_9192:5-250(-)
MALAVEEREAVALKYLQPIKSKFDDDTFDYISQVAVSVLQEAAERKDAESELEDALVPHLEAQDLDAASIVKCILDGIFPE